MKKILFLIQLFVGANCSCLPLEVRKEIIVNSHFSASNYDLLSIINNSTKEIQTSVDQLNQEHIQTSSTFKKLEHKLDEMQKKIDISEQIMDKKFEDLQNLVINTDKLQTSGDQRNEVEADSKKYNIDWHSSSFFKKFEYNLDEILKTIQLTANIKQENEEQCQTSSIFMTIEDKLNAVKENLLEFKAQNLADDDCLDLHNLGLNVSSSYLLQKYNRKVFCDMETDGGGWLVIQRRRKVTKQVDFYRNWVSYKEGFGDLDTEFWIGNEFLHRITNQKSYELRIDMKDFENVTLYATYSDFRLGNEASGYKLHVGGYKGNATDSLSIHNNKKFSTFDRDNDFSKKNCASKYSGAFWHNDCYRVHWNGVFPTVPDRKNAHFIRWYYKGAFQVLVNVEVKIRPKIAL